MPLKIVVDEKTQTASAQFSCEVDLAEAFKTETPERFHLTVQGKVVETFCRTADAQARAATLGTGAEIVREELPERYCVEEIDRCRAALFAVQDTFNRECGAYEPADDADLERAVAKLRDEHERRKQMRPVVESS